MTDLSIFKAYDIRGIVPKQLDANAAYLAGGAFVQTIQAKDIAVAKDVRISSDMLERAFIRGATEAGANIDLLGTIPTDALYFAVGKLGYDGGAMITASHNPAEHNGFKLCREKAIPLSGDSGLPEMKAIVREGKFRTAAAPGHVHNRLVLTDYIMHCLSFVNITKLSPFRIGIDTGNGVAGIVFSKLIEELPFHIHPLFFEPDGNFPNHLPNPIEPENTAVLRRLIIEKGLDFGVAFDGDGDRMFIIDELGNLIGGDMITAIVARKMLQRYPKSSIVYNLICSRTVPDVIKRFGGTPIRSRVGHAFIKPLMRENNAAFGGEHSGHFYFRDHWFADSGLIAFLIAAELFSEEGKTPSQLISAMDKYFRTGEINTRVSDREKTLDCVAAEVSKQTSVQPNTTDGTTFSFPDWWFNLRPSNTEPLLRLNLEASSEKLMAEKRDWLLEIIRKCGE